MREIKFRGMSAKGELVYGNYATTSFIEYKVVIINGNGFGHVRVSPETVGQFTGLQDSQGVDIYEGDILSIDRDNGTPPEIKAVRYRDAGFNIDGYQAYIGKIIGNIHENPELLEGQTK